MKVCSTPGCPELTDTSKCERHRKAERKRSDRKRPNAHRRGYDQRWARTRKRYLAAHPICEDPEGCIEKATDVDHIDGLGPNGPHGHDDFNLRALCHSHHSRRTAKDQPGGWAA